VTRALRRIGLDTARRLAVHAQRLDGTSPRSTPRTVLDVIRAIRCVQLDPIAVVARSPHLVLHSRLDAFRPSQLDRLLFRDRALFEYWAHAASIVLTEDLPIHAWYMRNFLRPDVPNARYHLEWIATNAKLRRSILSRLRREGPLPSRALADVSSQTWRSSGWTNDRNVDKMLTLLWSRGVIMVAGRQGQQKLWDIAERVLPPDAPRRRLSDLAVTRLAVDHSLRALGVGTVNHVRAHFTPGRFPELARVMAEFERRGRALPVEVEADADAGRLPGRWFVHADHLEALERLEGGAWVPRATMLSPFDNLIRDRARSLALFDLDYRIEIYVPKDQRRYGYYAMPVLDGDRFVARVDPAFVRDEGRLRLHAVHGEDGHERSPSAAAAVAAAVRELAAFLGAEEIDVAGTVPRRWRAALD
jgi:uncharacterized protein YcaQ